MSITVSRRTFLYTSLIASLALISSINDNNKLTVNSSTSNQQFRFLRNADLALFLTLIPLSLQRVVYHQTPNYQALQINILKNIDKICSDLTANTQTHIYQQLDQLKTVPIDEKTLHTDYQQLNKLLTTAYLSLPEAQV